MYLSYGAPGAEPPCPVPAHFLGNAFMNRPLAARAPLVPEDVSRRASPSIYLARAATAHLRSFTTGQTPANCARAMYGEGDRVTGLILRAATSAATTQQTGWAADLAQKAV